MPETTDPEKEERDHALNMTLFAVSAGMVGVCLTSIGILRLVSAQTSVRTIGDDLLAIDAVVFVLACGLSFAWFRVRSPAARRMLRAGVDVLVLAGLIGMAGICSLVAYTVL
jgi:hypothetical protein